MLSPKFNELLQTLEEFFPKEKSYQKMIEQEGGLAQWLAAIQSTPNSWHVHLPPRFESFFHTYSIPSQGVSQGVVTSVSALDLTLTLRTHAAEHLHEYIALLLAGDMAGASRLAPALKQAGYYLYITDSFAVARAYLTRIYHEMTEKTYGIVASTWARNLVQYGIFAHDTDPHPEVPNAVTRFFKFNDVPRFYNFKPGRPNPNYCCTFHKLVTEFDCQGLELDGVLLAWGTDLVWNGAQGAWMPYTKYQRTKNPAQIRLNSYRVLMTRGRDGLVIFCPGPELAATFHILQSVGFELLTEPIMGEATVSPKVFSDLSNYSTLHP